MVISPPSMFIRASHKSVMFVVRRCFQRFIRSIVWKGRFGAIHLFHNVSLGTSIFDICCLCILAVHGEPSSDSFSDLAALVRSRPFGAQGIILGEWNVDCLPSLSLDPWKIQLTEGYAMQNRECYSNPFLHFELSIPSQLAGLLRCLERLCSRLFYFLGRSAC